MSSPSRRSVASYSVCVAIGVRRVRGVLRLKRIAPTIQKDSFVIFESASLNFLLSVLFFSNTKIVPFHFELGKLI